MMDENQRLKKIIRRMKKIQQDISADGQPVSQMQIAELERLGSEYAEIVTVLRTATGEVKRFKNDAINQDAINKID
jgi:hypothetical protein